MSAFDAFKTQFFRMDAEGHRVATPFGTSGDVIVVDDDARADRIARGVYTSRVYVMMAVVACLVLTAWSAVALLGIVLAVAARRAYIRRLVAGEPRAAIRAADLPRVDLIERRAAYNAAYGRRQLWGLVVVGGLIVAIGLPPLVAPPFADRRSLAMTLTGVGCVVFGVIFAIAAVRALRSIPRSS